MSAIKCIIRYLIIVHRRRRWRNHRILIAADAIRPGQPVYIRDDWKASRCLNPDGNFRPVGIAVNQALRDEPVKVMTHGRIFVPVTRPLSIGSVSEPQPEKPNASLDKQEH